ncbi:hypothetical protein CIB48_g11934 [Xylaria polymorpha]|nr:hypothetical protein CIB48_g11934 [Xylaria polymorpha]
MALASRDEYNIDIKLRDSFTKVQVGARKEDILQYVSSSRLGLQDRYLEDGRITGPETDDDSTEACRYSILRKAVSHESMEITKLLVDHFYSVKKPSLTGRFIIHEAWDCEGDIIKLLLDSGASHLGRDLGGNSVWHLAARNFKYGTISALLQVTGD